jgi:diaminopimelate epimerase
MRLRFTKMHGQGNDFVMLNGISQPDASTLTPQQIRAIADRHFGIGCDQVLLVEAARDTRADFRYRIFNASGEEVEHCGNGARCFPVFVRDEGLTTKTALTVETMNGLIYPSIQADGSVSVDMGAPRFDPAEVPFIADSQQTKYSLHINDVVREIGVVSMGNPHAVQIVDDVDTAPVAIEGVAIEHHPRFPKRVNAGFMQVVSRSHIRLRVWERGAGETLACGTGACAAVVVGIQWGLLDPTVRIVTRGGELSVTWQGGKEFVIAPVIMTGAATTVFHGAITLSTLDSN